MMVIIVNLLSTVEQSYSEQKFVIDKRFRVQEPIQVANLHPYAVRHAQIHIHPSFLHLSYCLRFQDGYLFRVNGDVKEN